MNLEIQNYFPRLLKHLKNAKIISAGNGDVKVNASETFTADGTGNGDIINKGKAKPSANSKQKGNGEIINN